MHLTHFHAPVLLTWLASPAQLVTFIDVSPQVTLTITEANALASLQQCFRAPVALTWLASPAQLVTFIGVSLPVKIQLLSC